MSCEDLGSCDNRLGNDRRQLRRLARGGRPRTDSGRRAHHPTTAVLLTRPRLESRRAPRAEPAHDPLVRYRVTLAQSSSSTSAGVNRTL
jgi:hypothetical protein